MGQALNGMRPGAEEQRLREAHASRGSLHEGMANQDYA